MPKRKAFIDSSVLIRGLLFEETNSALIIKLISKNVLTGVINRKVAYEVLNVLKEYFTPKEFLESMKMKTYDTEY